MRKKQQTIPHILDSDGTRPLVRVPYSDRKLNETWLQNLLFENPSLLPIEEIEPAFAPLTSLARELPTKAGPIDLLFVSPLGYITIGETKLVRNPEARREVVAQTLDYAKELSQWTYDDLISAIQRTRGSKGNNLADPIFEAVKDSLEEDDFDTHQFRKAIGQSLRHGRFLLLIIGDQIREDVEWLVEYLQDFAHLQFKLGLIELGLFRLLEKQERPLLVIPRIVARTNEIIRAIVRIEGDENLQKLPIVITPGKEQETSPSREAFLQVVRGKPDAGSIDQLEKMLRELEEMGTYVDPIESGIALRFPDPGESSVEFRLFRIQKDGRVRMGLLKNQLEKAGYDGAIAIRYWEPIANWIGGKLDPQKGDFKGIASDHMFPLKILSETHKDEYINLVRDTLDRIRAAAESQDKSSSTGGERP